MKKIITRLGELLFGLAMVMVVAYMCLWFISMVLMLYIT
jgi:hypothetical protein